jgi:hypothetical protein
MELIASDQITGETGGGIMKTSEHKAGKMKFMTALLAILILVLGSGCSLFMAYKQPDKKDLAVLNKGTLRNLVVLELGQPAFTETKNNVRNDVFVFVQGYSSGVKASRFALHGAADVLTFGAWEVLGTPVEMAADGTKVKVQVAYDARDCVDYIQVFEGNDELKGINSRR